MGRVIAPALSAGTSAGPRVGALPRVDEWVGCRVFSADPQAGNPTAVVRLSRWPDAATLMRLAGALPATEVTFLITQGTTLQLRWFTSTSELPLCGHGALAAAALLAPALAADARAPDNLAGRLWLSRDGDQPAIVLPAVALDELPAAALAHAGLSPTRLFNAGRDYLAILDDHRQLEQFSPAHVRFDRLDKVGLIVSAPATVADRRRGLTADFRFFAPRAGILEDHGSASVLPALMAWWSAGRPRLLFQQRCGQGVVLRAQAVGGRVHIAADVFEFARGDVRSLSNPV